VHPLSLAYLYWSKASQFSLNDNTYQFVWFVARRFLLNGAVARAFASLVIFC
jgi:hypothetical protein